MEFFFKVIHDATQTLSDHHPSLIIIALQPMAVSRLRKSSYLKLDVDELGLESTITALKDEWSAQMADGRDPQINWDLGWKEICKRVLQNQKDKDEVEKNRIRPKDQLYDLWIEAYIDTDPDPKLISWLKNLEDEVRKRERYLTNPWRICSKATSLKIGDAPMTYFFKLVHAKRIHESIKKLMFSDGH